VQVSKPDNKPINDAASKQAMMSAPLIVFKQHESFDVCWTWHKQGCRNDDASQAFWLHLMKTAIGYSRVVWPGNKDKKFETLA
jgi:hypothetical protein